MNAEIVTTGTELLLGVITDTNSTYIARQLRDIGLDLYYITSAGDNEARVARAIEIALERSDVVITTGGLGPTVDDVTREAVARATGRSLVVDETLLVSIEAFFAQRGYPMSTNNRRQARIPQGAIPIENPVGTAPCFVVEDPRGVVISLPGVPREMKYLMAHAVLPYLRRAFDLHQVIVARTLRTCGIGESALDARIDDLETSPNPTIGLAAHPGQSDIRITAKADSVAEAEAMLSAMEARVRERVDDVIFGLDDDRLEAVVIGLLRDRSLTVAAAEVSTGGLLCGWLSDADPVGETYLGGWVLPDSHAWALGEEATTGGGVCAQARALAARVCAVTGARVGVAVINTGPEETAIEVLHDGAAHGRVVRYRGHEADAHTWTASLVLDLVRRLCLGLPTEV
ncbi:MAG: CinA family nicotinamide mononucleotide deamidase-related protein [Anaerolineae bacterium]|nr:CinA family nicotinamide mononucleotide deamidase-related protein [Anaerolineae bacterium]